MSEEDFTGDREGRKWPLPMVDVSANGWVTCLAAAGREHVAQVGERPRPRPPAQAEECLYCRAPSPQGGEEHILSVALGNWFWVIPPNVVCGDCNHGRLSRIDAALQKHPFISLIRVLANIPGRRGQLPEAKASNVSLKRSGDGTLQITSNHERHIGGDEEEVKLLATWTNQGDRHPRDTARALFKFALGMLWLARGPGETQLPKYDHIRDLIAGDKTVPVRQGFGNSSLPSHALQGMVVSHEQASGLLISLDYFGIRLSAETDGPAGPGNEIGESSIVVSPDPRAR